MTEFDIKKKGSEGPQKPIKVWELKYHKKRMFTDPMVERLKDVLSSYLEGRLTISQEQRLTSFFQDERYLDLCRHFDSSFIIRQID